MNHGLRSTIKQLLQNETTLSLLFLLDKITAQMQRYHPDNVMDDLRELRLITRTMIMTRPDSLTARYVYRLIETTQSDCSP